MGVWYCDRVGCVYIMPDRYSPKYGYICEECFDELCSKGKDADIGAFMSSYKGGKEGGKPSEFF